jgi:hypothetical protein
MRRPFFNTQSSIHLKRQMDPLIVQPQRNVTSLQHLLRFKDSSAGSARRQLAADGRRY